MKKEKTTSEQHVNVYTRITDRIIAALDEGVRPWVQPWNSRHLAGRVSRPLRHNGEPYSGINVLLLWSEAMARGYASSTWMTFRQAQELGACVRRGETGSMVVYANRISKTETDGAGNEIERDIPFLKAYSVFNVEQIERLGDRYADVPDGGIAQRIDRIAHADVFFAKTGATVRHGGDRAYYAPGPDIIQMPPIETFQDSESYYATLAHESVHWAGASHRLNRDLSRYAKDRTERAREELIAELGAAFLAADLGMVPELEPRPDHASYLASWLSVLKNDKRFIVQAAAQAQRSVTFLHDLQTVPRRDAAWR
ncbi:ArdC family protein [Phyllobacterium chamaecytisi]|uniref:ArdC family protein n=1 Tax=Phyllobacterium chamaecytisi TaxID=2876082 RepID=UPI001CCC6C75|nr:zincin-like metallopeptidase domain-containing protein [Phyllobacterium sp. KW56]MBZ9605811.1 ssDNA-binding domain-containing protein [Phyllobacterium sp. KW56]